MLKIDDALRYAQERDLDLVEVAPDAKPPVCRVLDYSKYKYEQAQKQKQARKHQQQITIREIKFRPKIAQHDYDTKKGHVERFLRHKDKVKVTIMFRGREVTHPERGVAILDRLAEELAEYAIVEQRPLQDGRNMTMMLGPSKAVLSGHYDKVANGAAAGQRRSGRRGRAGRAAGAEASVDGRGPEPDADGPGEAGAGGRRRRGARTEPRRRARRRRIEAEAEATARGAAATPSRRRPRTDGGGRSRRRGRRRRWAISAEQALARLGRPSQKAQPGLPRARARSAAIRCSVATRGSASARSWSRRLPRSRMRSRCARSGCAPLAWVRRSHLLTARYFGRRSLTRIARMASAAARRARIGMLAARHCTT